MAITATSSDLTTCTACRARVPRATCDLTPDGDQCPSCIAKGVIEHATRSGAAYGPLADRGLGAWLWLLLLVGAVVALAVFAAAGMPAISGTALSVLTFVVLLRRMIRKT